MIQMSISHIMDTYKSFQLLNEDKSVIGNGHTFGEKVFVYIGERGREHVLDSLSDVLGLPGVHIFQWLPDWADDFDGTEPYSYIPKALDDKLTKTERLIYSLLRRRLGEGIHKDILIRYALKTEPDEKINNNLRTYITKLRKKLPEGAKIACQRGIYTLKL